MILENIPEGMNLSKLLNKTIDLPNTEHAKKWG